MRRFSLDRAGLFKGSSWFTYIDSIGIYNHLRFVSFHHSTYVSVRFVRGKR